MAPLPAAIVTGCVGNSSPKHSFITRRASPTCDNFPDQVVPALYSATMSLLPDIPLLRGIRARFVDAVNGLRMHVLDAGFETAGRPCIVLLHGFPELANSWLKVMPQFATA